MRLHGRVIVPIVFAYMPSKYRKTLSKRKERYIENSETLKRQAVEQYELNKKVVIERAKNRIKDDTTGRMKNAAGVKRRLQEDPVYVAENRKRAKLSQQRRLQTDQNYRRANLQRAKESQKRRLKTDENYRLAKQQRAKDSQKRRLQTDENYRLAKQQRAKESHKKRREGNEQYRKKHQEQAKQSKLKRMKTSQDYLQKQHTWNRESTKRQRLNNACAESNRRRSRAVYARVRLRQLQRTT